MQYSALRMSVMVMLLYVLETRWDQVIDLCPDHLLDYGSYMVAFMEDSKMDQYRDGAFVPFMDTGEKLGVCSLLREMLDWLPMREGMNPIFRVYNKTPKRGEYVVSARMTYSRSLELLKEGLEAIGENSKEYGLHSLRAGARSDLGTLQSSLPEQLRIPTRLLDRHGLWAPGSTAAVGYAEENASDALLVPAALQL